MARGGISFLHTAQVHVPTFAALMNELAPDIIVSHTVNERLLVDARELGADDGTIVRRVQDAMHAAAAHASVVVCTCSTIGGIAEAMSPASGFTATRIDRAMADEAVRLGPKILVVAAIESTLAPTKGLIESSAERLQKPAQITTHLVEKAWEYFEQGDKSRYHSAIAQSLAKLITNHGPTPDVVVLAQASMAPVVELLREHELAILSSPRLGVEAAIAALRLKEGHHHPENQW